MGENRYLLARGWLPALVIYTDALPGNMGGMAHTFMVVIRPEYRDDRGLHEHELEHVAQWYAVVAATLLLALAAYQYAQTGLALGLAMASIGMQGLLYRSWRKFRLWSEAGAYARQMQFPDRKGKCLSLAAATARLCSPKYDLRLSDREAEAIMVNY